MNKSDDVNTNHNDQKSLRNQLRRRWLGLSVAGLIGAILGGTAVSTVSHAHFGSGYCSGFSRGYWGHHRHGPPTAEMARERADFAADWVLKKVNATEEQRVQIKSIVEQAVNDLFQFAGQHRSNREGLMAELAKPNVDRAALEKLRTGELGLVESASSRLLDTLVDITEVLTPEQRLQLVELAQRYRR